MLIRWLPLLAGVIPVLAGTLAHWLGAHNGVLPACNPWLDGCTSISATGRNPPGSYLFRAVHMPYATILAVIWYFCSAWLAVLCGNAHQAKIRTMLIGGVVAAISLIVYVTFLGTSEPIYEFMRRFGIYGYFLGTAIAQLMLSLTLAAFATQNDALDLKRLAWLMLALVTLPFILGILNLVLKVVVDDYGAGQNRIEWITNLAMQVWFVLLYVAWRRTGFRVAVTLA